MSKDRVRIEAALDVLGLYTASKPLLDVFRESAALDDRRYTTVIQDRYVAVYLPGKELPKETTLAISNCEGLVSDDKLALAIYLNPYEDLCKEETEIEPWGTVETGYDVPARLDFDESKRGFMMFTVEANIPGDFNPTDSAVRWALGRITRLGELVNDYIKQNGKPDPLPINQRRGILGLKRAIESKKERIGRHRGEVPS